jgi:hypothetical protein
MPALKLNKLGKIETQKQQPPLKKSKEPIRNKIWKLKK